ncbi:MAG TPA: YfiR/HmsC family protein [Kofleriaceae bacterium]|nr:YfiR/HmsC family protein [Kofleriaceae bacterium]
MRRFWVVLFVAMFGMLGPAPLAAAETLAPKVEALMQLKVLSYDRARKEDKPVLAVIARTSDDKQSESMRDAFTKLADKLTLNSHKITVVAITYDAKDFKQQLADKHVTILYSTESVVDDAVSIGKVAADAHIPTLSNNRKAVTAAFPVGVIAIDSKPKILINVKAAKAVGMDLDPKLLALSELIR